jgi:hypothetical protein
MQKALPRLDSHGKATLTFDPTTPSQVVGLNSSEHKRLPMSTKNQRHPCDARILAHTLASLIPHLPTPKTPLIRRPFPKLTPNSLTAASPPPPRAPLTLCHPHQFHEAEPENRARWLHVELRLVHHHLPRGSRIAVVVGKPERVPTTLAWLPNPMSNQATSSIPVRGSSIRARRLTDARGGSAST